MLNDSTSSKTNDQKQTVDTIPPVFVDQGDLPPMINSSAPSIPPTDITNPSPATVTGSAAPTDDIVSTVMPAITTSGTPKKKFAGGKIIATILGLFLLIGGVGAGVYLTGQNQNMAEKANGNPIDCSDPNFDSSVCESGLFSEPCVSGGEVLEKRCQGNYCVEDRSGCTGTYGGHLTCPTGTTSNGTCEACTCQGCSFYWMERADGKTVRRCNRPEYDNVPICCTPNTTTVIPVCQSATISKTSLAPGESLTITSTATTSDITGFSYGFYNLDNLYGPDNPKPIWFTANTDYTHAETVSPTNSHTTTVTYDELNRPDLNGGGKPTKIQVNAFFGNSAGWNHSDAKCVVQFNITLGSTAQCQGVKAYDKMWTLLSPAELSSQKAGDTVIFCVSGSTSSGSFDKGKFTINGVVQPETTDKRPGSQDFCQVYPIPYGVSTFNITAQIHHVTLGWANCTVPFNFTLGSTQTISCTSLTSNVANPVVGQEITGTCHGNVTGTNSAVARFAVTLNGTVLGASGSIPLNAAGTASYTATVPQEGNYLVQCQICTDSTLSNCTTMGQAN